MYRSSSWTAAVLLGLGTMTAYADQRVTDPPGPSVVSVELASHQQATHHYYVYYWCHGGWQSYGCYSCPMQAQSVANSLQQQGYATQIVCSYGYGT